MDAKRFDEMMGAFVPGSTPISTVDALELPESATLRADYSPLDLRAGDRVRMRSTRSGLKEIVTFEIVYAPGPRVARVRDGWANVIIPPGAVPAGSWSSLGLATPPSLGGCTCYDKAPTVPTCRSRSEHLANCPGRDSGFAVGVFSRTPEAPDAR